MPVIEELVRVVVIGVLVVRLLGWQLGGGNLRDLPNHLVNPPNAGDLLGSIVGAFFRAAGDGVVDFLWKIAPYAIGAAFIYYFLFKRVQPVPVPVRPKPVQPVAPEDEDEED